MINKYDGKNGNGNTAIIDPIIPIVCNLENYLTVNQAEADISNGSPNATDTLRVAPAA